MNRIFCVGLNYPLHITELSSTQTSEPMIFLKPMSGLLEQGEPIVKPPYGERLVAEAELVVQLGKQGRPTDVIAARSYVAKLAVGLDLTLRDVQQKCKQNGWPWEMGKAFDGCAAISPWVECPLEMDLREITFEAYYNDVLQQQGRLLDCLFSVETALVHLAQAWTLQPGDILFTGTPSGCPDVFPGDKIAVKSSYLGDGVSAEWWVQL